MISSLALAKLCGVSQGTVDRALHDRPGISAATRARILAAARQHGYLPNPAVREMLGLAASTTVGAVVPAWSLRAPFFMELLSGIAERIAADGLRLSLHLADADPAGFAAACTEVAARRPRGLAVVLPPTGLELPASVVRSQKVISLLLPCATPGVINLLPDEQAIGAAATGHLLALGHRRIVHLPGPAPGHWATRERLLGYEQAMRAARLEPLVIRGAMEDDLVLPGLRSAAATAAFCHSDPMALALIRRLRASGLRVPEDLAVMGVDRSPLVAAFAPELASIAFPFAALAAQMAAALMDRPLPPLPAPEVVPGATAAGPSPAAVAR